MGSGQDKTVDDGTDGRLILASGSPRRAELLRDAGYDFKVVRPTLVEPEQFGRDVPPVARAEALSYFKARDVLPSIESGLVIAADTVVALGDEVFGKPKDIDAARRILLRLAGTTQSVITGLTVLDAQSSQRVITSDQTLVHMRKMSADEMEAYLDSGGWEGKAGAYGIQDHNDHFVERIEGSFSNVVGLPMELLAEILTRFTPPSAPHTAAQPTGS
jgi:nucleoside triphosphate pyrophosphatase